MAKEFSLPIRVYYEDTDAGGVVYYANYLKYFERARTEWLRDIGFEQDDLIGQHDVIFAVRSVNIEYLLPARFNQELIVITSIAEQKRASIHFDQRIYKNGDDTLLCQGFIRVACLEFSTMKPRAIPEMITKQLELHL
ncbi:MAG: tol-pal system-associated acyl-CoA thioesterase [Gammaproteobacteria bacterium]|nr:MAG: tol-pal system-associated acyl-CoA thioesterase [Gammaproteobacteria bacterium]